MAKTRLNISKFKECFGCGVCVSVCPVKIISYGENSKGFYQPYIQNNDKCINCGLCLDVCAYNYSILEHSNLESISSFAGCSRNKRVLESSSSGGLAYELAKWGLSKGYGICGAIYRPEISRVEHVIVNSLEDLKKLQGSKYIPSNTIPAFQEFKKGKKYMIFGTPCQIDSLRNKIQKFNLQENFILIDFFCHGVPSLLMWDQYLEKVMVHTGSAPMVFWRNKVFGWHESYRFIVKGATSEYISPPQSRNIYYKLYLNNFVLNDCCYGACKYKQLSSRADIRLGDFWGKKFEANKSGVNCVISFTEIGKRIVTQLSHTCDLEIVDTKEAIKNQMRINANRPIVQKFVIFALRHHVRLVWINNLIVIPYNYLVVYPKKLIYKIFKIFNFNNQKK